MSWWLVPTQQSWALCMHVNQDMGISWSCIAWGNSLVLVWHVYYFHCMQFGYISLWSWDACSLNGFILCWINVKQTSSSISCPFRVSSCSVQTFGVHMLSASYIIAQMLTVVGALELLKQPSSIVSLRNWRLTSENASGCDRHFPEMSLFVIPKFSLSALNILFILTTKILPWLSRLFIC